MTIHDYLRDKRLGLNLSQADVADMLKLSSAQFVSNVERGLCNMPLKKLNILVKHLKLDKNKVESLLTNQYKKKVRSALGLKS